MTVFLSVITWLEDKWIEPMMRRLAPYHSGKYLVGLLLVNLIFAAAFRWRNQWVYPEFTSFDTLYFGYGQTAVFETLNMIGQQGRINYAISQLTLDVLYPIYYGLFLTLLFSYIAARGQEIFRLFMVLPLVIMLFDFVENLLRDEN